MNSERVSSVLEEFSDYPLFPDGRIDYTDAPKAAAVNVIVVCDGEYLLLQRSKNVHTYKGKWMTVAGYLDEPVSVEDKALEELREEVGVTRDMIRSLETFDPLGFTDEDIGTTFIIFPVLCRLSRKPRIELDEEHVQFRWVMRSDIPDHDVVPSLPEVLELVLG